MIFLSRVCLFFRVRFWLKLFGVVHAKMEDGFFPATGNARKLFFAGLLDNDTTP